MKRRRALVATNAAALALLAVVYLVGWREAAAFGLGVLVIMDGLVLLGERLARRTGQDEGT